MLPNSVRWLVSGLLLVATVATAFGQVVYKWKDSDGNVHFTDAPPPSGATLLKGPKPAQVGVSTDATATARDDKSTPPAPCRHDLSAAECKAVRRSLHADLDDLESTFRNVQGNPKGSVSDDEAKRLVAAVRTSDCAMWRDVLASLTDRQNDRNPERLTEAARTALPAQIADAERRIAGSRE